jgi:transcriptional regulator with XRE-family HTH domain
MKKKISKSFSIPEFENTINTLTIEDKIFVDKSMEIARHVFELMQQGGIRQKDLALRMKKTEAEVSKWLSGLHNFTLRSLVKMEAALGCPVVYVPKMVTTPAMTHHARFTIGRDTDNIVHNQSAQETEPEEMSFAA